MPDGSRVGPLRQWTWLEVWLHLGLLKSRRCSFFGLDLILAQTPTPNILWMKCHINEWFWFAVDSKIANAKRISWELIWNFEFRSMVEVDRDGSRNLYPVNVIYESNSIFFSILDTMVDKDWAKSTILIRFYSNQLWLTVIEGSILIQMIDGR